MNMTNRHYAVICVFFVICVVCPDFIVWHGASPSKYPQGGDGTATCGDRQMKVTLDVLHFKEALKCESWCAAKFPTLDVLLHCMSALRAFAVWIGSIMKHFLMIIGQMISAIGGLFIDQQADEGLMWFILMSLGLSISLVVMIALCVLLWILFLTGLFCWLLASLAFLPVFPLYLGLHWLAGDAIDLCSKDLFAAYIGDLPAVVGPIGGVLIIFFGFAICLLKQRKTFQQELHSREEMSRFLNKLDENCQALQEDGSWYRVNHATVKFEYSFTSELQIDIRDRERSAVLRDLNLKFKASPLLESGHEIDVTPEVNFFSRHSILLRLAKSEPEGWPIIESPNADGLSFVIVNPPWQKNSAPTQFTQGSYVRMKMSRPGPHRPDSVGVGEIGLVRSRTMERRTDDMMVAKVRFIRLVLEGKISDPRDRKQARRDRETSSCWSVLDSLRHRQQIIDELRAHNFQPMSAAQVDLDYLLDMPPENFQQEKANEMEKLTQYNEYFLDVTRFEAGKARENAKWAERDVEGIEIHKLSDLRIIYKAERKTTTLSKQIQDKVHLGMILGPPAIYGFRLHEISALVESNLTITTRVPEKHGTSSVFGKIMMFFPVYDNYSDLAQDLNFAMLGQPFYMFVNVVGIFWNVGESLWMRRPRATPFTKWWVVEIIGRVFQSDVVEASLQSVFVFARKTEFAYAKECVPETMFNMGVLTYAIMHLPRMHIDGIWKTIFQMILISGHIGLISGWLLALYTVFVGVGHASQWYLEFQRVENVESTFEPMLTITLLRVFETIQFFVTFTVASVCFKSLRLIYLIGVLITITSFLPLCFYIQRADSNDFPFLKSVLGRGSRQATLLLTAFGITWPLNPHTFIWPYFIPIDTEVAAPWFFLFRTFCSLLTWAMVLSLSWDDLFHPGTSRVLNAIHIGFTVSGLVASILVASVFYYAFPGITHRLFTEISAGISGSRTQRVSDGYQRMP